VAPAAQHLARTRQQASTLGSTLEALESKSKERTDEVEAQKTRLDQAIQKFLQQSADAEQRRAGEATKTLSDVTKQVTDFFIEQKESHRALQDDFRTQLEGLETEVRVGSEDLIAALLKQRDRAAELVGIIARTGMAGGFEQAATSNRNAANIWRRVAVTAMLGVIGVAIYTLLSTSYDVFAPGPFAAKVLTSLAFVILAGYSSW
jgi:hypothetical protein